jgi:hypothetical protein
MDRVQHQATEYQDYDSFPKNDQFHDDCLIKV